MQDSELPVSKVHLRGTEPSLIEKFGIEGLYGYRSISLESEYAATILIAKNGTGKTTLLAALDAFLRMQLSRLRNLEFNEIRCKLRGEANELVLTHNDVIEFLQVPTDGEMIRLASRANVEPASMFNFILDEWRGEDDYSHMPREGGDDVPLLGRFLLIDDWNWDWVVVVLEGGMNFDRRIISAILLASSAANVILLARFGDSGSTVSIDEPMDIADADPNAPPPEACPVDPTSIRTVAISHH